MSSSSTTSVGLPGFNPDSFATTYLLDYFSGDVLENLPKDKQAVLDKLLDNLSTTSFIKLSYRPFEHMALGKAANPIHPFNTFEFFLSTPERVAKLKTMYSEKRTTRSIWNPCADGFAFFKEQSLQGFAHFLKIRHEKKSLIDDLDDFCRKTGKDIKVLSSLIEADNYRGFVEEVLLNIES